MRLLNVTTLELEEFGDQTPQYCILSHTWGKEEVLFHDMINSTAEGRLGYKKVSGCCDLAKKRGIQWVWIDTLCIDKSSSAELSEAINSMYKWYSWSHVCFVYLSDVQADRGTGLPDEEAPSTAAQIWSSRWFTRGWTLQELIAPSSIEFFTRDWDEVGTKASLAEGIAMRTGIPIEVLCGEDPLSRNVAERMSWAAERQTTREEDISYCLLGLFNVNMPLLYGEGRKAFRRLQEQILKQEEDYTIFTWFPLNNPYRGDYFHSRGVLAQSPSDFARPRQSADLLNTVLSYIESSQVPDDKIQMVCRMHYKEITQLSFYDTQKWFGDQDPPSFTSRGIQISLPVWDLENSDIIAYSTMLERVMPELRALAWVYCNLEDQLLCLVLDRSGAELELNCRALPYPFVTVDRSLKNLFKIKRLYMRSNNPFRPGGAHGAAYSKIQLKSQSATVIKYFPERHDALASELAFTGVGDFTVAMTFRLVRNARVTYFQVACGFLREKHWCGFGEESATPESLSPEVLYNQYEGGSRSFKNLSRSSDRSAMVSQGIPGLTITAELRRERGHIYQLGISDCRTGDENLSMRVYLETLRDTHKISN